jgi:hypothetical protein
MFWLAVGLGAGVTAAVMVSRWVKEQQRRMAPANLARQAQGTIQDAGSLLSEALREFRQGMQEKEAELRANMPEPPSRRGRRG